jgi:hypothetical protein
VKVELTHRISEIRLWVDNNAKWGDKYQIFLEVVWLNQTDVEFVGLTEKITKLHWNDIIECCERHGIKRILAKRFRLGVPYDHWIEVTSYEV